MAERTKSGVLWQTVTYDGYLVAQRAYGQGHLVGLTDNLRDGEAYRVTFDALLSHRPQDTYDRVAVTVYLEKAVTFRDKTGTSSYLPGGCTNWYAPQRPHGSTWVLVPSRTTCPAVLQCRSFPTIIAALVGAAEKARPH